LNDHKIGGKYKAGQKLTCRVLDVDSVKKIADLKELPKGTEDQGQIKTKFKADQKHKVVVELIKDDYLIVSFKNSRATLGICLAKNFNQDSDSQDIQIGDEVEAQVNKLNKEGGFYELIQVPKETKKKRGDGSGTLSELKPGIKVNGQIKSIKAQCIYVQLPKSQENPKQVQIGRLHMIECQSISEFKSFAVNDRIECKILHIQKDKGTDRTWIEMTRSEKHLVKHEGLDED
jgi:ribosomal protein S1